MKLPVTRIQARNFRSLARVDLRLGPLNVLIGPNGSGKTNVLNVLRFLATTVRFDLAAALQKMERFRPHPAPVRQARGRQSHHRGSGHREFQRKSTRPVPVAAGKAG